MTLYQSARDNPDAELGHLLEFYRPYLLRLADDWIESDLRPRFSASDAVQQTMVAAAAGFENFSGQTERDFRKWIVTILQNQLVNGWRFHRQAERRDVRRQEVLDEAEHDLPAPPSDRPLESEDIERLLSAIEELPKEHKDVVRARYLEGLSFDQIAEQRETSRETIRRRWKDAVHELGRRLGADPS
ncbi:MAG: sigma-70 family RNA polymerase sigma factor [Planctomycetaceae bacterium]